MKNPANRMMWATIFLAACYALLYVPQKDLSEIPDGTYRYGSVDYQTENVRLHNSEGYPMEVAIKARWTETSSDSVSRKAVVKTVNGKKEITLFTYTAPVPENQIRASMNLPSKKAIVAVAQ